MQMGLCQRGQNDAFGKCQQKQLPAKQTFEQIPLTIRAVTGKMVYGIMYGMLGSMVQLRFIYIRHMPGASVLRPMAF